LKKDKHVTDDKKQQKSLTFGVFTAAFLFPVGSAFVALLKGRHLLSSFPLTNGILI